MQNGTYNPTGTQTYNPNAANAQCPAGSTQCSGAPNTPGATTPPSGNTK